MRGMGVVLAAAIVLWPGSPAAAAAPRTTVDIGAGTVNGQTLLGRSAAGVVAILGTPSWRVRTSVFTKLGYGDRRNFRIMVILRRGRATSVVFERQPLYERTLGTNVLALPPAAFARAVRSAYTGRLGVTRPLRCSASVCDVVFAVNGTDRHVTFGRTRRLGSFLTLWAA